MRFPLWFRRDNNPNEEVLSNGGQRVNGERVLTTEQRLFHAVYAA